MLDYLDEELDEKSMNYFDVQNLSFDHPLTYSELDELQTILFNNNNLSQIYFKNDIDVDSIEIVKNLLLLSNYVDDKNIEKIIAKKFSFKERDRLLNASYKNPETWKIAYKTNKKDFILSDLPNCRSLYSFIYRLKLIRKKENLSNIETLLRIYDIVKLIDLDNNTSNDITEMIRENKTTEEGYSELFTYILQELGYFAYSLKINNKKLVAFVCVEDEKYNIKGFYLFNPFMDSLSKETYKNEDIRMINYNYFSFTIDMILRTNFDEKPNGILEILTLKDKNVAMEKKDSKNKLIQSEKNEIEELFNTSFESIYDLTVSTKPIEYETIRNIIKNVYGEDRKINKYYKMLDDNYNTRYKELFKPNSKEIVEEQEE